MGSSNFIALKKVQIQPFTSPSSLSLSSILISGICDLCSCSFAFAFADKYNFQFWKKKLSLCMNICACKHMRMCIHLVMELLVISFISTMLWNIFFTLLYFCLYFYLPKKYWVWILFKKLNNVKIALYVYFSIWICFWKCV